MRLKRSQHCKMFEEASFVYCKRHNINLSIDDFLDQVLMTEDFDEAGEFDKIAKDLRFYKYMPTYELKEITEEEYDSCVMEFGGIE